MSRNPSSSQTKNTVYIAVFAAMIAAMGLLPPITLGIIPVPITLQTLGVMLAGAPGADALLLAVGAWLEVALPWADRHPPVWS